MLLKDTDKTTWPRVKFGDVVKNVAETCRDAQAEGLERYLGLDHFDGGELKIRRWGDLREDEVSFTRRFRKGQVLFAKRRAYQRKVAVAEFDGICSSDILCFEPKDPKTLLPELLPFLCQTDAFFNHALGTSAGSLSPRTRWSQLKTFEFPLPPLAEQKRLAKILWAAEEAEQRYATIRERLDILARVDFSNSVRILQKNAPSVCLRNVLAAPICNGIFKKAEEHGSGCRLVNVTDVYRSFRIPIDILGRIQADENEQGRFSALPGDVIFNRSSLVFDGIGHAALFSDSSEPVVFECHLMRARPNVEKVDPKYLCRFALSSLGRKHIYSRAQTTTMTTINQGDLGSMPVVLPSLEKQIRIANRIDQIEEQEKHAYEHQTRLRTLKTTLLASLFEGGTS